MRVHLKNLNRQVIVITGASSGIGLVTARMAASRGARIVLVARNENVLKSVCADIRSRGGAAIYVVADVGKEEDVRQVARTALLHYGGFDTWVNGAAVSIYGKVGEVATEDEHRLFETNFWGTVYGSRIAAEHLRRRGGSIVNIGSILSDRAVPLQAMYSASKHAVKAFTDALRMELRADGAPVSVSLIKPGSIDTPYVRHARNYMDVAPSYPPPVYAPELVAQAILHAATHGTQRIMVGGAARLMSTFGTLFPALTDRVYSRVMPWLQRARTPSSGPDENNLHQPARDGEERSGNSRQRVLRRSAYTSARLRPVATGAAMALAAAAFFALRRTRGRKRASSRALTERGPDRIRRSI